MSERFSCARLSQGLGEPLVGTASTVARWLLIEQPGPWGRDPLPESGLGDDLGNELKRRCGRARVRPLLIRRADGSSGRPRTAYLSSSRGQWAERILFEDPEELLTVDLGSLRADTPTGGEAIEAPLLLTCTNGRHDACCAELGRPIAALLEAVTGEHAWEVSHIGGDRFAANVLWLPAGVYYGRIDVADVPTVAALASQRRISLDHYRGRSLWPFAAQAAEVLLRRELVRDELDAVALDRFEVQGARGRAVFRLDDARWEVRLTIEASDRPQQLTCRAIGDSRPARYRDIEMDKLDA